MKTRTQKENGMKTGFQEEERQITVQMHLNESTGG